MHPLRAGWPVRLVQPPVARKCSLQLGPGGGQLVGGDVQDILIDASGVPPFRCKVPFPVEILRTDFLDPGLQALLKQPARCPDGVGLPSARADRDSDDAGPPRPVPAIGGTGRILVDEAMARQRPQVITAG